MILLDTSVLIDGLTGSKRSAPALRSAIEQGERMVLSPSCSTSGSVALGSPKRSRPRKRGREIDLAIAATALCWDAKLWTLNIDDFKEIPELVVERPHQR